MDELEWTPDMELGVPLMDLAHQALLEQIARLLRGPDQRLEAGFLSLTDALERDFREEELLMETIGFPGIQLHREQHARVLTTLHRTNAADVHAVRRTATLLLRWFRLHLATLDTVLAAALELAGQRLALPSGSPGLAGDLI